jgi:hypothetical protein
VWQFQNSRVKFALAFILSKWLVFGPFCFWNLDFVPKLYFSYFPIPSLRKEWESSDSSCKERKSSLTLILSTKGCSWFQWIPFNDEMSIKIFFNIPFPWDDRYELEKFFEFELILCFWTNLELFKVIKGFIKVSRVFVF